MARHRRHNGRRKPTRSVRRPGLLGTVHLSDKGGTVETAEGTLRLMNRSLREVMAGDTVTVSVRRGPHGEKRALVEDVVERAATSFVGTYAVMGPLGVVRPLDTRLRADFFIPPEDDSAARLGIDAGDLVVARIASYPTRVESGVVTLDRKLGGRDARDAGIWSIMARYDLKDGYPAAAEDAALELSLDVGAALADPLRRDITDRFVMTIDPVDARDFDDAISIARTDDDGFDLGVHIADVSHYVPWDSPIDLEARSRGTSVYLADRVLPMLPERLSNDLCSLVPDADRLAMTVDMHLDACGNPVSADMYPSIIRSRVRLSYDQADELLARAKDGAERAVSGKAQDEGAGEPRRASAVPHGGATLEEEIERASRAGVDLAQVLIAADELARARKKIRAQRGAVDFETVEVHAVLDDEGRPVELGGRDQTPATSLIEEAMLLANEAVAQALSARGLATAYRVHEPPSPDHLHDAARALLELGIVGRSTASAIAAGDQSAMRRAIEETRGTGASEAANALLLRSMMRAVYKPQNEGHYALGAPAYCHFTSPIRRYPDICVHRVLKYELARERLGAREARKRARYLVGTGPDGMEKTIAYICRTSSERERVADAAGRASQKVKVAQYYSERIGERAWGTVCWMDVMGVFVRIDGTHAEGLVRMSALGGEWFDFDERTLTATGASSGKSIALGDRVIVEVASTDPVRGHLDLKLVHRKRTLH